jgi:hypothetical protein
LELRRRQIDEVSAPTFHEIAAVLIKRLESLPGGEGVDDVGILTQAISEAEAESTGVPSGTAIPPSLSQKAERCLNGTVADLVRRGLVTSSDTLARVLPQITSGIQASGILDLKLRRLYSAIYRAFRRRRSLLLLNLQRQVGIEALPWVQVIDQLGAGRLSSSELSKQTLEEVSVLALTAFPHAIIPNKLLQEFRALAVGAELDLPLVDELAADIFMGKLSSKFLESAKIAAELLENTLYEKYYGIEFSRIRSLASAKGNPPDSLVQIAEDGNDAFFQLCVSRSGVRFGTWDPAINGMIIEQQQILTTQNLAVLYSRLHLRDVLANQLGEMARHCFEWICRRQQMKASNWHAQLIMLKNTAYAWRQMIFFLALSPTGYPVHFLNWAEDQFQRQTEEFKARFRPALAGLEVAVTGAKPDNLSTRSFLGWSKDRHWLFPSV